MKVIVCGHNAAGCLDLDEPYAVISITDPGDTSPIKQRWGLQGVLKLAFKDIADPADKYAMTPDHAREIVAFARGLTVDVLVVHCWAGVSRSVSVAMALADGLGWGRVAIDWRSCPDDACVFDDAPNRLVYGLVAGELSNWESE